MPKAAIADLTEFGFKAQQFSNPANFADEGGYLDDVITAAGLEVQAAVGASAYAAIVAGTANFARLVKAEKYFAAAELYRRREVFDDSDAEIGGQEGDGATISSRYLTRAQKYEDLANYHLGLVTGKTEFSSLAVGYAESGPYPAASV